MALKRKLGIGLLNVLRFNWHFYAVVLVLSFLLIVRFSFVPDALQQWIFWTLILIWTQLLFSLGATFYNYDLSQLYDIAWLDSYRDNVSLRILNIHAGYDETSELILEKNPQVDLKIYDFYDPKLHTEVSIARARKIYPTHNATIQVKATKLPETNFKANVILVFMAAHEIRNEEERTLFFKELKKNLDRNGVIFVTEHLRDFPNALAYSFGSLHFFSRRSWLSVFENSGFRVMHEMKVTPFVTTFKLESRGNTF